MLNDRDKKSLEFIKDTDTNVLMHNVDQNGVPYLKEVYRLHKLLFGESCTGCTDKIPQYIEKLHNYDMEVEQDIRQFRLKEGVVIPVFGSAEIYSNQNLTDKEAINLLRNNIDLKPLFSKLPDNLDELLAGDAEVIKEKPKRKPVYVKKTSVKQQKRKYTKRIQKK